MGTDELILMIGAMPPTAELLFVFVRLEGRSDIHVKLNNVEINLPVFIEEYDDGE